MLPEFGHFALILALCLALTQVVLFKKEILARPLALGQALFVQIAFLLLMFAFANDDFSVQYVAHNSNSNLPLYYKLTAVWSAHEGSLLLWITILNCWMLAVCIVSRKWPLDFAAKVLNVLAMLNLGFIALALKTSNPFLRYLPEVPLDGADLNPLLQDFGMTIHPPILYIGYVGFAVCFAFAVAGLLNNKLDREWAQMLRPWVLFGWAFLTLGITIGSWWAYYELGWGGWWFWDPVENASFMPWLTATALIHCLSITSRNNQFLILALFLCIITFGLSLFGTFLVRSGAISSVHAFASDPKRGIFILQFLSLSVGGGLLLLALRAPKVQLQTLGKEDIMILGNNILLLVAAGTVLLGTLYPIVYDLVYAQKISVGYPYFNKVFIPLSLMLLALMLATIMFRISTLIISVILSALTALCFLVIYFKFINFMSVLGLSMAAAIIVNTLIHKHNRRRLSMSIAHIGLAITIIGISISPNYEIEKDERMKIGEQLKISNYTVDFKSINNIDGSNYVGYQGEFIVKLPSGFTTSLHPEKRVYLAHEAAISETAILPRVTEDIYIALGQQLSENVWTVRVYYKPFVRWIWLGAILMAIGALLGIKKYS